MTCDHEPTCSHPCVECLEDEVDRLREALEQILDHAGGHGWSRKIAREALARARTAMPDKPIRHAADCYWLRAYWPIDGDEAACCSCGALEDAYDEAVKRVDARHGYTVEFSPDPEGHRAEYAAEARLLLGHSHEF